MTDASVKIHLNAVATVHSVDCLDERFSNHCHLLEESYLYCNVKQNTASNTFRQMEGCKRSLQEGDVHPKSSYPNGYRTPIGTEHTHLCSAVSLEFDRVNLVKSDDARRLVDEDEGLRAKNTD